MNLPLTTQAFVRIAIERLIDRIQIETLDNLIAKRFDLSFLKQASDVFPQWDRGVRSNIRRTQHIQGLKSRRLLRKLCLVNWTPWYQSSKLSSLGIRQSFNAYKLAFGWVDSVDCIDQIVTSDFSHLRVNLSWRLSSVDYMGRAQSFCFRRASQNQRPR